MEIKQPLTRNFNYFLNKGILNFVGEVRTILEEAIQAEQNAETEAQME